MGGLNGFSLTLTCRSEEGRGGIESKNCGYNHMVFNRVGAMYVFYIRQNFVKSHLVKGGGRGGGGTLGTINYKVDRNLETGYLPI